MTQGELLKSRLAELNQPIDYYDLERQDRLWRKQNKKIVIAVWTAAILFSLGCWAAIFWRFL